MPCHFLWFIFECLLDMTVKKKCCMHTIRYYNRSYHGINTITQLSNVFQTNNFIVYEINQQLYMLYGAYPLKEHRKSTFSNRFQTSNGNSLDLTISRQPWPPAQPVAVPHPRTLGVAWVWCWNNRIHSYSQPNFGATSTAVKPDESDSPPLVASSPYPAWSSDRYSWGCSRACRRRTRAARAPWPGLWVGSRARERWGSTWVNQ